MSEPLEFEVVNIPVQDNVRKMAEGWTIEMEDDIHGDWQPRGIKILSNNEERAGAQLWRYKVVALEQRSGKLKIIQDSTKTCHEGKRLTREKFNELYFTEAI